MRNYTKEEQKEYEIRIDSEMSKYYMKNDIIISLYKREWEIFKLVKELYPKAINHYYPKFLNKQHYDIYIPELNVAIEHQGKQHYEEIGFFGSLEEIQKRDKRKIKLSEENNIILIYWKYDEPINKKILEEKLKCT